MKIIETNIENLNESKQTLYKLTMGESLSVQKMDDEELDKSYPVDGFVLYEDENNKGETVEILSILSNGLVLSTVSKTFKTNFFRICDLFGEEPFAIRVSTGNSKNGRRFFDCVLGEC